MDPGVAPALKPEATEGATRSWTRRAQCGPGARAARASGDGALGAVPQEDEHGGL